MYILYLGLGAHFPGGLLFLRSFLLKGLATALGINERNPALQSN